MQKIPGRYAAEDSDRDANLQATHEYEEKVKCKPGRYS
jgi:hypothetical protein